MAHMIETMAYRNELPWHGLGNQLPENQPMEVWLKSAGMDWEIREAIPQFQVNDQNNPVTDAKVLYRSDNLKPLSIVSNRYKVVQPRQVLEFYRELVDVGGFELETAGVLKEGRKLWALAKTGQEVKLKGNDLVKGYLLLATACDGTLATTAQFTSVRVVCNNTLSMAVGNEKGAIKVSHSTVFDAVAVKKELGLGVSVWQDFMYRIRQMANQNVSEAQSKRFLADVLGDPNLPVNDQPREKVLAKIYDLYTSKALGSDLASSHGTAWGLVNAVTEYVDHQRRSRAPDSRLHSAWFGQGAVIKQRTFEEALKLAA